MIIIIRKEKKNVARFRKILIDIIQSSRTVEKCVYSFFSISHEKKRKSLTFK